MKKNKKTFSKERLDNLDKAIGSIDKELKIKKALKKIKKTTRNWNFEEQIASLSGIFKEKYWDFNPETMTWKYK